MIIRLKRVYDTFSVTDGKKVLVDRLWPRGVRRNTSNIDVWIKEIAPSDELRKWFAHDIKKWDSFKKRYFKELEDNRGVEKLLEILHQNDPVTLVYAASDSEHNNAVALLEYLDKKYKVKNWIR